MQTRLESRYLTATLVLVLVDLALSLRAWFADANVPGWFVTVCGLWLLASGILIAVFRQRGTWAGAPISYVIYGAVGMVLALDDISMHGFRDATMPSFWRPLCIVLLVAVLVTTTASLRALGTGAETDDAPEGFRPLLTVATLVAGVVCAAVYLIREPVGAQPAAAAPASASPAPAAPVPVRLKLRGKVTRPDDVTLPNVTVRVVAGDGTRFTDASTSQVVARTDRAGRYTLEAAFEQKGGKYLLTFETPGYKTKTFDETASDLDREIDVVMSPDV